MPTAQSRQSVHRPTLHEDRRRAILRITRKGRQLLSRLTSDHARELTERAPRLAAALKQIQRHAHASGPDLTNTGAQ